VRRFRSAAAVIIGNEVLTAKVDELNGSHLIRRLRDRGIPLKSLAIVPDEIDAIVEAVTMARAHADCLFTSGGIGPTHDDLTVEAVALALGRQVIRDPSIAKLVVEHYGKLITDEGLRLADVPEGTELLWRPGIWYPVMHCDGVFLLPGVPQLFKLQLETILSTMEGTPVHLKSLYLSAGEAEIAHVLDQIALAMPHVAIGSYPQWAESLGYRVKITVEHEQAEPVEEVVRQLMERLPARSILRAE